MRLDRLGPDDLPHSFGQLTLSSLLGDGGTGRVFRAETRGVGGLPRVVALLALPPRPSGAWGAALPFVNQARLLRHRGIVQTFSCGEHEGGAFVVTELVEGLGLDELVERGGVLSPRNALDVGIQLCAALANAQGLVAAGQPQPVVHGDLKASRVMVGVDGVVKARGWGLAAVASRPGPGDPVSWGSPEALAGQRIDGRADLFDLGCILAYSLVALPPFSGADGAGRLASIRGGGVQGLLPQLDEAAPGLGALAARLLAPDPGQRFQNATEAEAVMRELRASLPRGQRLGRLVSELAGVGLGSITQPGPAPASPRTAALGRPVRRPDHPAASSSPSVPPPPPLRAASVLPSAALRPPPVPAPPRAAPRPAPPPPVPAPPRAAPPAAPRPPAPAAPRPAPPAPQLPPGATEDETALVPGRPAPPPFPVPDRPLRAAPPRAGEEELELEDEDTVEGPTPAGQAVDTSGARPGWAPSAPPGSHAGMPVSAAVAASAQVGPASSGSMRPAPTPAPPRSPTPAPPRPPMPSSAGMPPMPSSAGMPPMPPAGSHANMRPMPSSAGMPPQPGMRPPPRGPGVAPGPAPGMQPGGRGPQPPAGPDGVRSARRRPQVDPDQRRRSLFMRVVTVIFVVLALLIFALVLLPEPPPPQIAQAPEPTPEPTPAPTPEPTPEELLPEEEPSQPTANLP